MASFRPPNASRDAGTSGGPPAVLLWSGGKDAALALNATRRPVRALVTTVVEGEETVTMHGTPLRLIRRQAESLGIELAAMSVPPQASNATYEASLERALAPYLDRGAATVVVGDIHLEDVRAYREDVLAAIGAEAVFPLWRCDPGALARRFVDGGYRAVVASVDTEQLDASFAGRPYDAQMLRDLPDRVDPCGESGAFHTFVTDGPRFASPVPVRVDGRYGTGRMRYARLTEAEAAQEGG
jgi:uncharacterized protein (TIGR00290 family)